MNDGKLYVKSTCMVCRGKIHFCVYCDGGLTYTEAADTIIAQWLHDLPPERLEKLIGMVKNETK